MASVYIFHLITFFIAVSIFTVTPGLDTAVVLRMAASSGRRGGAGAVLGILAGISVWGVGAMLGLTELLAASHSAFMAVKFIGALYLIWMGLRMMWQPRSFLADADNDTDLLISSKESDILRAGFLKGFLTNILNPKVGIFVITFFPQFIPQHVDIKIFTLLQVVIQIMLSAVWLGILVMMTTQFEAFLSRPAVMRCIDRLTGGIFVVFGMKLFMTQSPSP
ncbi:LysE family transporter [Saccharibacter sp. 17.LH.SD]|uniref:LysE family translocator n=1 Tax=Saccharibacter sp. 17.LH.SD TaxID=2689393 RepID=UPI00136C5934|nr:LysE family translocator [Saccharibacter sp. 17.LH.SD]MXV44030.1 LysE family transporter [Saccharibacter sp. 17.LH.SD]